MRRVEIRRMIQSEVPIILSLAENRGLELWSDEALLAELARPDSICLVAKAQKTVLGFLIARPIMSANITEIYNIGVRKDFERQGIASKLLRCLLKIQPTTPLTTVLLEVRASNRNAIAFYLKNRFAEVGRRKNFYSNPVEDAIIMSFTDNPEKIT